MQSPPRHSLHEHRYAASIRVSTSPGVGVLAGAKLGIRSPCRRNCSENLSWRHQLECRICQSNSLARKATVRTSYKVRTVSKRRNSLESNGRGAVCPNVGLNRAPTLAAIPIRSWRRESYNVRVQFIASRCRPTNVRDQIKPAVRRTLMRKIIITSVAAVALFTAGTFFGSMQSSRC